ncbi:hypothetical protein AVEN_98953-1 [Araneus ventricosus]|uniref:Uncharacterized protein n=1 Tax=Araneus ventricosus TaxID=182803 RepID=A0A4Y2F9L7_ARAVE|nr:hypothetical protein AVEN_98953-1 [Araneus ventricosus]
MPRLTDLDPVVFLKGDLICSPEERRVDPAHQRSSWTREFESGLFSSKDTKFSSSEERRSKFCERRGVSRILVRDLFFPT